MEIDPFGTSRLGSTTSEATVGADAWSTWLRSRCQELRLHLVETAKPTGSCIVLSGAFGRSFVTCYGAVADLQAEHCTELSEAIKASGEEVAGRNGPEEQQGREPIGL